MFVKLAIKSLQNRRGSVMLTVMAMTVSVCVLLAVEHIRLQAKQSFANTVSGVDLIVGARTGSLNLLLYSVFRMGSATNNLDWNSYQAIIDHPQIEWAIPMSLGDSHKGYRVLGTSKEYFEFFSYGHQHQLQFDQGEIFNHLFDVVIGAEVAHQLGYAIGDQLVLSHGIAATSFSVHDDRPFTVVGILEPTGTPVDQTLHVSLAGIEAIHIDWQQGVPMPGRNTSIEHIQQMDLTPKSITAFMLGLKSRIATFGLQRKINEYPKEPLMAILPGVALSELWQMMSILEKTLRLIAVLIFIASLLGLSAVLLASIRERHLEVQLLRSIGASPTFLFLLMELEAVLMTLCSIVLGAGLLYLGLIVAQDVLAADFGLYIQSNILSANSGIVLLMIVIAAVFAAAIPSLRIYQHAQNV